MLTVDLLKEISEYIDSIYVDPEEALFSVAIHSAEEDASTVEILTRHKELVQPISMGFSSFDEVLADYDSDDDIDYSKPQFSRKLDYELFKHLDESFSETLLRLIDERGLKDSDVYKKADVSRQHFNKIKNVPNYKPTKTTAIAFALALELSLKETNDLLSKAGFVLSNSSKFDIIIKYCIEQKIYDIITVNQILFSFDQELL